MRARADSCNRIPPWVALAARKLFRVPHLRSDDPGFKSQVPCGLGPSVFGLARDFPLARFFYFSCRCMCRTLRCTRIAFPLGCCPNLCASIYSDRWARLLVHIWGREASRLGVSGVRVLAAIQTTVSSRLAMTGVAGGPAGARCRGFIAVQDTPERLFRVRCVEHTLSHRPGTRSMSG